MLMSLLLAKSLITMLAVAWLDPNRFLAKHLTIPLLTGERLIDAICLIPFANDIKSFGKRKLLK